MSFPAFVQKNSSICNKRKQFMRRLLALVLVVTLWFGFAPVANAAYSNLTPCSESTAFQAKAKLFRNTTGDSQSGANRAARYSEALCGPEGYPHLIVDGNLSHLGDFAIPSIIFLYITGWIGWVGRAYLIAISKEKDAELKEVVIDVPLAISKMMTGFAWPALALQEFTSGQLVVKDSDVPVSPR
jgi:photosystem I subunit 3